MDDPDTLVDPQMRREVQRPRPDARRPLLLIAIVATAALTGALAMAMWFASRSATTPAPRQAPTAAPLAPARPAAAPARAPCLDYGQKGEVEDGQARRSDCLR